jgi:hypothetical protein
MLTVTRDWLRWQAGQKLRAQSVRKKEALI